MLKAGEHKRGKEIGIGSKTESSRRYIWAICRVCNKGRWMQERETKKSRFSGLCHKCRSHLKGAKHWNWKGGIKNAHGYKLVHVSNHPRISEQGYVREHILVWEKVNKKMLPEGWIIHHYNGIKDDNRPSNLLALSNKRHVLLIPMFKKRIKELEKQLKNNLKPLLGNNLKYEFPK